MPAVGFTALGYMWLSMRTLMRRSPRPRGPPCRASTIAPMPRPKVIHIGAKWIAVEGPRLPATKPIIASVPASAM